MLTRVIGDFVDNHPAVELNISELEMLRQLEAIAEGRMDIGFIRPPVPLPRNIDTIPILFEDLILALNVKHSAAMQSEVDLADLAEESFIIPAHATQMSFHHHTTVACQKAGFQPRFGRQGRDFMTIASMVSIGLGVALVPKSIRCIQLPSLIYKPIKGHTAKAELAVAFRRGDHSPIVRSFIAIARHHMQQVDTAKPEMPRSSDKS
jgi:DNA-binding transcriptional LysR family regulator